MARRRIMNTRFLRAWWPALVGSVLFVAGALTLIPYPGLQEDEMLFGPSIWHPQFYDHATVGHLMFPRMLLSYLGATKTWLFLFIFKIWRPSLYSVRVPVILIYAMTIWIFYAVLRAVHSRRAGAVGALLLATDPTYVLTGSFGWCNLQNVLMLASIGALLRFCRSASRLWLAAAAVFAGLWLWDKAVGMWMLSGLLLAVAILYPREAWSRINRTNIAIGAAAFCVGAFPLILFNVKNDYPTLRSNARFSTVGFRQKVEILKNTAQGSAWLGNVVNEPAPDPRTPRSAIGKWTVALHDRIGDHPHDDLPYALGASVLLLPMLLAWRRYPAVRLLLFSLIVMCVAWLQMALTEGAGTGAHHPALMWPFPELFIAIAFAEASLASKVAGRWLLAAAVVFLMVTNLLTVNQYLYQFVRFGGAKGWSDAIYALSDQIPGFQADRIFVPDWGVFNPLTTLSQGQLPLQLEFDAFSSDHPSAAAQHEALEAFAAKNSIWVVHTAGNEMFAGVNARLDKMVSAAGYRKIELRQVRDQNQTPVFEIFRIVRGPGPMLPPNAALSAVVSTP
jgi:Dolichyl-phosphate-mannose-protein mannosyltransferase